MKAFFNDSKVDWQASENFSDMASVFFFGVRVDEYVVEVHQYTNIEQVTEDVIHEALESSRCVGESKRHYAPFEGAVASPESHLPFVALLDLDQMVGVPEVDCSLSLNTVTFFKKFFFYLILALRRLSRRLMMRGRGYQSFFVILFKPRKSTQSRSEPSFLCAKRTGAPPGDRDGWMKSIARCLSKNSQRYFSSL